MKNPDSPAPLSERVHALRLPEASSKGVTRTHVGWLVICVSAIALAWFGRGLLTEAEEPPPKPADNAAVQAAEAGVRTMPTPASAAPTGDIALESKGYIIPAHQVLVSPKVSGMVVQLNFEEGVQVERGDVLAVIETTEFQSDHDSAQAALESARQRLLELERGSRPEEVSQAKAELGEAEAQLQQLELEWKRTRDLHTANALSQQEFERVESDYLAMQRRAERLRFGLQLLELGPRQERIDAARAEVQQREADLRKAKWRLDNCTIRAPISGTILRKNAEEGNIVNPVAFNGSFSLCDMADLSDLEVELTIQERDISQIFQGQRCRVRAEAYPDRVYQGVVSRMMPIADRAKGALPVRVKVTVPAEEEGMYLKPEMGAVVTFYAPVATDD